MSAIPGGQSLSLACPRESNQREGHPRGRGRWGIHAPATTQGRSGGSLTVRPCTDSERARILRAPLRAFSCAPLPRPRGTRGRAERGSPCRRSKAKRKKEENLRRPRESGDPAPSPRISGTVTRSCRNTTSRHHEHLQPRTFRMRELHATRHRSQRTGWLRAAVLGANDGILSTAGLIVGVASAQAGHEAVVTAGVAGLVSGALSMAAGEYVSVSSQRDAERADLRRERHRACDGRRRRAGRACGDLPASRARCRARAAGRRSADCEGRARRACAR